MDILSATDLASNAFRQRSLKITQHSKIHERHGLRRCAFDREPFIDVLTDAERLLPSTPSVHRTNENVVSVQMNDAQVMALSQNSCDGHDPRQWL
jgi:hypothetical protein